MYIYTRDFREFRYKVSFKCFKIFFSLFKELNKAWCADLEEKEELVNTEEPRRKSPSGRQGAPPVQKTKVRQEQQKKFGKENRPKGRELNFVIM